LNTLVFNVSELGIMGDVHEIFLPKKVIVGNGAVRKVVEVLGDLKVDGLKVGVITGENTYKAGGHVVENMVKDLAEAYLWKAEDPSVKTASHIAEEVVKRKVNVVIGVGGGKAIDIAKYVAYVAKIPMLSIPLAPSHDGVASPFSSLKGANRPYSVYTTVPYSIIADIELVSRAPRRLVLSGLGDLLGKFVSVRDWALAHRLRGEYYGEYAAQLALLSAKHAMKYHELIASATPEGIRILVEALISSGVSMCIAGSSRPASGSEHLFAHALELLAPGKALHGEAVALGTIIMLYIYGDPLWKRIKRVAKKVGLPTTAKDLGIPDEVIVSALTIAHTIRPERYTVLGEKGLSEEAAVKVLRETGIIE